MTNILTEKDIFITPNTNVAIDIIHHMKPLDKENKQ
jgi:hypothetical protein